MLTVMPRVVRLLLLLAVLAGCSGGNRASGPRDRDAILAPGDAWRPRPVAMRVYPSTRFVEQEGHALLEARLELSDEMGDPAKYPGEFRLELYGTPSTGGVPGSLDAERQLYAWRVPVVTLEQHRTFFDPITRVYLLRLKLDPEALPAGAARLRASYRPIDGDRLRAEATIAVQP